MQNGNYTSTSDSAGGVQVVWAGTPQGSRRGCIVLRHQSQARWCGAGGDWVEDCQRAVRFATNLDAIVYCQALGVRGVVEAFSASGTRIYELNVDRILDSVFADAPNRFRRPGRRGDYWNIPQDGPDAEGPWIG